MHLELLTIGTELLLGFSLDTNGAELGRELGEHGLQVVHRASVPDDATAIRQAVAAALERTGAVIVTGGLGPTRDDLTRDAVSELLGMPLAFDGSVWAMLESRFHRLGRPVPPANRAQAMVPQGATVLPNQWGTAPGLWLEGTQGLVILLPGVPMEMRNLLRHEVLPRLATRGGGRVVRSRTLRTTSIAESALAGILEGIEDEVAPLTLAWLPGLEGVDLRFTAWDMAPADADAALQAAVDRSLARAAEHVYAEGSTTLAEVLVTALRAAHATVAVAESCTGGLLGGRITDVPGSSDVFRGGVIAYANEAKVSELGVDAALIDAQGAVSEPVAVAMANGVRQRLGATWGVGITGVAGPGGGSPAKPVGTVWMALTHAASASAVRVHFPGSRADVRARAVQAVMFRLLRQVRAGTGA